jgi:hypothetical protein
VLCYMYEAPPETSGRPRKLQFKAGALLSNAYLALHRIAPLRYGTKMSEVYERERKPTTASICL